jgi:hypothetical protein
MGTAVSPIDGLWADAPYHRARCFSWSMTFSVACTVAIPVAKVTRLPPVTCVKLIDAVMHGFGRIASLDDDIRLLEASYSITLREDDPLGNVGRLVRLRIDPGRVIFYEI